MEKQPRQQMHWYSSTETTVLVRANRASGNSPFVGLYERMADNELEIQRWFDTN
jgi:hypothetical protein